MSHSIDDLFTCFGLDQESESVSIEANNVERNDIKCDEKDATNLKREHEEDEDVLHKRLRSDLEVEVEEMNFDEFRNRIVVHTIQALESCSHEVAVPPGQTYVPLVERTSEPAKKYAFALDPFQKESILCIDNNQSVLVSAHTSAGKTVVAEYAVALSFKNKQRVIYTTPIKALSNQKYREFLNEFKDVGLITGDVTINPSASCLIMTTEILRNMLYRGSEIMREVGWVIFDEIHYMRDKERGVVWEETIILLPRNSHFVFLSATIPNARQFAEWVAHLHQQPCHVVYTDYRPTPLQHYIFPAGGEGIHTVVDLNGTFKEDNFNTAMSVLQASDAAKGDRKGRNSGIAGKDPTQTDIFKVVKMIMDRDYAPVIVFSFSKKNCELYAKQMTKLDFNSSEEKELVKQIFDSAITVLSEEDKSLLQITNILPLLLRGIGIHHGGLLPVLKETIEILFGEGLIKALFATETFAMGLNMPARTVLFTGMRKFDGSEYRWITSGEYVQMSGRAGRRGIDTKGIVILMVDEKVPPAAGREIIKGAPDAINSAFHLTYNMVLNLLRIEDINPEFLLERSFFQFQNQAAIPELHQKYTEKLEEYESFKIDNEEEIASYYEIRQVLDSLAVQFRSYITKSQYLIPFLQLGRLVKIKTEHGEYDWGVIANFKKVNESGQGRQNKANPTVASTKVFVDILLHILPTTNKEDIGNDNIIPKPCPEDQTGEIEVVTVLSTFITHLSAVKIRCPSDLRSSDSRKSVFKTIEVVKSRFNGSPPLLNAIEDMKISEPELVDIVKQIEHLEKKMDAHPMHNNPILKINYPKYEQKVVIKNELGLAKKKLNKAKSILQLDELKCRKRVLRRLGYCTTTDVIQLKGRVGCELSSSDEILLTEMIFNGVFGQLTPAQSSALLSCFVCDEKSTSSIKLAEELSGPLRQMQDLARRIAKVSTEARLPLDEESYIEKFKPSLMDVVFAWCNGVPFCKLCEMTDIFEGSIIRCIRRLEELLREMIQASRTIGNVELEQKFNNAIMLIKRDIVFAASLYL